MRVALLAGGTGGAKLGAGMQEEIGGDLTVIANTADDVETLGVHVSPDPDLVTYWLSGEIDAEAELDEDVLVCGDRKADKARVAGLVDLIPGLRAVNAGPLEMARIVEQLTPLLISVNVRYKTHAGIRLTGLPEGDHWA